MIRKATSLDISAITVLGIEFAVKSNAVRKMTADGMRIRETTRLAIEDANSVMLVLELNGSIEGVVYGVICMPFFSTDLVLQEMALYSRKATGVISLLEAFEKEGKAKGITKIVVGSKPDYCNLGKIYLRRGYTLLEEQYLKT